MFGKWLGGSSDKQTADTSRSATRGSVPHDAHLKPTIISQGVVIDGDLTADQGILHLDGGIRGAVRVAVVTVGPTGLLDGSLEASSVTVRGTVLGNVVCDHLVLDATARLSGNVRYKTLAISGGAVIDGSLMRVADSVPAVAV